MKKQFKASEKTKDSLVKSFWSIYKEKDISNISATEIIKKAGYNRSTFYFYFDNVKSVLNYIEDIIINDLNCILKNKNKIKDFEKPMFFEELVDFNKKYGEYIVYLLKKQKNYLFLLKLKKATKEIFDRIHNEIEKDEQLSIKYVFITSAIIGSFLYWNNNKNTISETEFYKLIFKLSNDTFDYNK